MRYIVSCIVGHLLPTPIIRCVLLGDEMSPKALSLLKCKHESRPIIHAASLLWRGLSVALRLVVSDSFLATDSEKITQFI